MTARGQRVQLWTCAVARASSAVGSGAAAAGVSVFARLGVAGARRRRRHSAERFARRLDRLGGAYLKAGQVLSTRADLLPDDVCCALGRLCDRATPAPIDDRERWLQRALGPGGYTLLTDLEPCPIAAGSVAHVYRARRADTGASVAIKVIRPDARARFSADLSLIRAGASLCARLPLLHSVPVVDASTLMIHALAAHLDLQAEADQHSRLAEHLATVEGLVIPRLHRDLSTPDALVMDYVEATRIDDLRVDPEVARIRSVTALRALWIMVFRQGVVHCDLHPGNVLVTEDGEMVLLDFGYVARLTPTQQHAFARLFLSVALDDPDGLADVVIDSARSLPDRLDREALTIDLGEQLSRVAAATVEEFSIARFVTALFAVQRRHRVVAAPDFVMSIVALISLEGLLQRLAPDLDFQREALPFVLERLEPSPAAQESLAKTR